MQNSFEYCGLVVPFKCFVLILVSYLANGIVPAEGSNIAAASFRSDIINSEGGVTVPHTVQNINHVVDYLLTLKGSQDEIFRKIDSLTKAVEEKDHEDNKFRLKFSRKVHTLENKVLSLEQGLAQNVEELVQKKLDDLGGRLRHQNQYQTVTVSSPSASATATPQINSYPGGHGNTNIQSQQPSHYLRYQQQPYHHPPHPQLPYQNVHRGAGANWGFYEHPITHKRVRSGNLYGLELPTRNLPLISLVATAESKTVLDDDLVKWPNPTTPLPRTLEGAGAVSNDEDDSGENGLGTLVGPRGDRNIGRKSFEESQKYFESVEATLQSLKENVTNLEREMTRTSQLQSRGSDNGEVRRLLMDNSREINSLQQKHQEMLQRIEHFVVEIEKAAAKRDHAVNESLREVSAEMKKQVNSLKAYTKKQVQNITTLTSSLQQAPDKLRCAQTLLDELLFQMYKPKSHQARAVQSELIADQAEGTGEMGMGDEKYEKFGAYTSGTNKDSDGMQRADELTKELESQRKEILTLKSEIARLNISQVLLKRTVDEETLKRKVRPRDCSEIRLLRNVSSGVYSVFPRKNDVATEVYCDMVTDGGGWTVIQRRGESLNSSGSENRVSFFRNWEDYERGFGTLTGDFWLGLSTISDLCQLGIQQLRIELTDWSGETGYATYQYFKISNSSDLYRIYVSGYSGTVGDSLTRHNGMAFSTPDKDNDIDSWRHCAKTYHSGWWYYACFESNLNGVYQDKEKKDGSYASYGTGLIWQHWKGSRHSLKHVVIKVRNTFIGDNQYEKMFPKSSNG